MRPLAVLGLGLAGCAGARASVPPPCPGAEDLDVFTEDGAGVHLHHHPGDGPPVLVVHGISSNHRFWDLDPEHSLARALVEAGFDPWLLDLRGHGDAVRDAEGRVQRAGWNVDDYGRYDVPAAIAAIRSRTGAARVGYVGHSMGGMVGAVYQAWHGDDALAALVAVGSPVDFSHPDPVLRWSGRGMAVGGLLPRVDTPLLARAAAALPRSPMAVDELLFNPADLDADTRAAMYRAIVSPLSRDELAQFARILAGGRFVSADGSLDYLDALRGFEAPLLAIAGRVDHVAPPDRVRGWIDRAGSAEKRWVVAGLDGGFAHDYGHLDLGLGVDAAREVYPLITGWLARAREEGRWEEFTPGE